MTQPYDRGMDEPTVVGRRPIGPSRGAPPVRPGGPSEWPGEDALTPFPAKEMNAEYAAARPGAGRRDPFAAPMSPAWSPTGSAAIR